MAHPQILIVDDQPDNLLLLQILLETAGYQVETAVDGKTALAQIQIEQPDLVLLDVRMPEMDGFEVAQRIQADEHLSQVSIALITADRDVSLQAGQAVGADTVIYKPIDPEDIVEQVDEILHNATPRSPHESE